jgi:hypothetical protein
MLQTTVGSTTLTSQALPPSGAPHVEQSSQIPTVKAFAGEILMPFTSARSAKVADLGIGILLPVIKQELSGLRIPFMRSTFCHRLPRFVLLRDTLKFGLDGGPSVSA